jgi:hypothetical protein
MTAVILDTHTGETWAKKGPRSWEWAENGYSCDCNRAEKYHHSDKSICEGSKRYLVTMCMFDDPDDYEYNLEELNADYPKELLREHGIIQ